MPPLVISRDNITIGGKIIETTQSIGLSKQVAVNPLANTLIQEPVFNDTSLIAHYKFDDDTNIGLNSSSLGSILDATTNGTPTVVTDKYVIGKSSLFSGAGEDDGLVIDSNSNKLNTHIDNKSITIAFWCWTMSDGESIFGRIFYGSPTGSGINVDSFQIHSWNSGQLGIIISRGGFDNDRHDITTNMPAFNTAWTHITLVIELKTANIDSKEHEFRTYVNGTLNTTFTNKYYPLLTDNYDFQIGRWTVNEDSREYDGYLDDFRIYNKVLTQSEITSLYFSKNTLVPITINDDYKYMSFVNIEPSLIAFYKFDGNYNDSSGNNHHLINNGASLQSTHIISGQAVDFDNSDFLTFPSTINPYTIWNGNGITFAFWTKISFSGNWVRLIDLQPTTSSSSGICIVKVNNTNKIRFQAGSKLIDIDMIFNTNVWRHISFSISSSGVWTIYINGVNQNVNIVENVPNINYNLRYINMDVYSNFTNSWDGQMDNFRIYNRVLSQADISSLYTKYSTLPPQAYTINFPEETEVQLLLLDNLKYIETAPFLTTGSNNIVVGVPSNFNTITTTTNSIAYNTGYVSTITGTSVIYNSPIVIIRYKTTKIIVPININEDYKYFSLTYNDIPDVVYDFTPYNTLQSWISYANSFGATTNVDRYEQGGVFIPSAPVGHITYPLPNNYNYIDVIFSNPHSGGNVNLYIDNVFKITATTGQTKTYSDTYTTEQILKIDETNTAIIGENLIIKLSRRQSQYSITFQENTECDILMVAGGGGGGTSYSTNSGVPGGGGGAGGLIFLENQTVPSNTYIIHVGKGGDGDNFNDSTLPNRGKNGNNSSFSYHPTTAVGGGGGGSRDGNESGADGGSGGGRAWQTTGNGGQGIDGQGFSGATIAGSGGNGLGGGGAGAMGLSSTGGVGKFNEGNFNFKEKFNLPIDNTFGEFFNGNVYFAGGGSGGNNFTGGGKGGGANGSVEGTGLNGLNNTGGGGAGCRSVASTSGVRKLGGNGGSGIVLIRYKKIAGPFDAQWTYNSINSSVYHLGNVGIGTINPTSALDVLGSVVVNGGIISTSLEANTKNFKIAHPLNINKWLYHGCVEGPRFDNMYRGKKMVIDGRCEVDIDNECNTTGGMTTGTFMALNNNCQVFLENKQTYDMVKGEIIDGKIIISCENIADEIEVEWLVIGERHDEGIIRNKLTNNEGMLICEH
jgi:hypothetical protein